MYICLCFQEWVGCDENIYALENHGNEIGNKDIRIVYLRFADSS